MKKKLSECRTGTEIEDRNGVRWTVAEFSPDRSRARIEGVTVKGSHVMDSEREVEVVFEPDAPIPGVDDLDVAAYRLTAQLGAEKVAAITEDGRHYAPATFEHVGSMLAHLAVMHGMDVSSASQTMPELRRIHSADHSEKASSQYIKHVHNDAKFAGRAVIEDA